jgi:hypothetical protein
MSVSSAASADLGEADELKAQINSKDLQIAQLKSAVALLADEMEEIHGEMHRSLELKNSMISLFERETMVLSKLDTLSAEVSRPPAPVWESRPCEDVPLITHCFSTRRYELFSMAPFPPLPQRPIDDIERKCERLSGFLSNSVHIINHIANSGDVQSLLDIDRLSRTDFQASLFLESARIEKFIAENGYSISDFALRPDPESIDE